MLKFFENLQMNCKFGKSEFCELCDQGYCKSYGYLINRIFSVSGL